MISHAQRPESVVHVRLLGSLPEHRTIALSFGVAWSPTWSVAADQTINTSSVLARLIPRRLNPLSVPGWGTTSPGVLAKGKDNSFTCG